MEITYIGHSGFLVETDACYFVFDYYKGTLPPMKTDKPVFVFASHAHQDHYEPKVFDMLHEAGVRDVTAALSDDILSKAYPQDVTVIPVGPCRTYELPCSTTVYTLRSTDEGVAFLLQCPEGSVYHAGDLNDWVWPGESEAYNRAMTKNYRQEIARLDEYRWNYLEGSPIDIACVPLDPRQETFYDRGMLGFLKKIPVFDVYPMHFWEQPEVIDRFLREHPVYIDKIKKCAAFQ